MIKRSFGIVYHGLKRIIIQCFYAKEFYIQVLVKVAYLFHGNTQLLQSLGHFRVLLLKSVYIIVVLCI